VYRPKNGLEFAQHLVHRQSTKATLSCLSGVPGRSRALSLMGMRAESAWRGTVKERVERLFVRGLSD